MTQTIRFSNTLARFAIRAGLFMVAAFIVFIAGYLVLPNYPYVAGILAAVGGTVLLILFEVALPIVAARALVIMES